MFLDFVLSIFFLFLIFYKKIKITQNSKVITVHFKQLLILNRKAVKKWTLRDVPDALYYIDGNKITILGAWI